MPIPLVLAVLAACTPDIDVPAGSVLPAVEWTSEGPVLDDGADGLQLHPGGWGRAGESTAFTSTAPVRRGDRMVYPGGGIDAWYLERSDGLQQGFDVYERPEGEGALEIRVTLSGEPLLAEDGLYWVDEDENLHASYTGLEAWDANGTSLRTELGLQCEEVCSAVIRVDDRQASYPVTIDPLLSTDTTTNDVPSSIELVSPIGSAMDLGGDWLAMWRPGTSDVLLQQRHGTAWTSDQWVHDTDFGGDIRWRFGRSISIDEDWMIVGGGGSVAVYENVGGVWSPRTFVDQPEGLGATTSFGEQVQLSGNTLVVPAREVGAVYIFDRDLGTNAWTLSETLVGTQDFGTDVAFDGDHLLISQYPNDPRIHVYERAAGSWSATTVVAPSMNGNASLDRLATDLLGDRALVGFPNSNRVYVLDRDSGGTWTETDPGVNANGNNFAESVALLDHDGLAVATPGHYVDGLKSAGQVEVWGVESSAWSLQEDLVADVPRKNGSFGQLVSADGGWLAVYESHRYGSPRFGRQKVNFYVLAPEDGDEDGFAAEAYGGTDCDDGDPHIHPDAIEVLDNAVDEDCDGLAPASLGTAVAGDLILSEIHAQPWVGGGFESDGQYVELTNTSGSALSLDGLTLVTAGGSQVLSTSAAVGPGGQVVVGASAVSLDNGGLFPDATWSSVSLDTTGVLAITGSVQLDAVDLTGWTLPVGASLSLSPSSLDATSNDLESSWCESIASYGENFGTPGTDNVCDLTLDVEFHWVLPDGSLVDGATDVTIAMDGTLTTGNEGEGTGSWSTTSAGQSVTWTYDGTGVVYTGVRALGETCFGSNSMSGLPADTFGNWNEVGCGCIATGDSDGDGVCDDEDVCDGGDDQDDDDGDGVPNGCELCEGFDDGEDDDGDGAPDGCDLCVGEDDTLDADGDGVPDGCDACEGHDDSDDLDGDGKPDACDVCPTEGDDDRDDVCDSVDVCHGFDDALDKDGDGVPDGCDVDDDCKDDGSGGWIENPYFGDLVDGGPTVHLVSGLRPGACWTSAGGTGAVVTVEDCTGATDQDWSWSSTWQTFVHSGGLCADASGTDVVLATCASSVPALGPDGLGRIGLQDCSACLSAQDLSVDSYTLKPVPCEDLEVDFGQRWGVDVQRAYPTAVVATNELFAERLSTRHHVSVWGPYARALSRANNGNAYVAVGSTRGDGRVAAIVDMGLDDAADAARDWVNAAPGATQTYAWTDFATMDVDAILDHLHGGGGVVIEAVHPFMHFIRPHPVWTTFDPKSQVLREAGLAGSFHGYSTPTVDTDATAQPLSADTRTENLTGAIELAARTQLGLDSVPVEDLEDAIYSSSTASLNVSNLEPVHVYAEALHRAMGSPEITKASPHLWDDPVSYDDLGVHARFFRMMTAYPDQVIVPDSVSDYPGVPGASETRVTATVTLDTTDRTHRWIPTGYYAAPGETVSVFVDGSVHEQTFLYAHWTTEWTMPRSCQLCPRSTARFPAGGGGLLLESEGEGVLNAPMGGPIFLMAKSDTDTVTVTLHNVLPQPHFVSGVDTDLSFAAELAATDVPFALMEDTDIVFLGHKDEIEAAPDGFTEMVDTLGDLWRAERSFSHEPGWQTPHMFFFDLRVEGGGAHSGNPAYLSHAFELSSSPFWQTDFVGKWGFLHEAGHSFSNPGNPFFISGEGTYPWREGEPNLLNMAAVDEVFGPGSHQTWDNYDDVERATNRENFVCDCLAAGGCDATDFGTFHVVDFAMSIADDPAIGWSGLGGVYASWTGNPSNWQDHIDQLAQVLSDEFALDFGPYMVAYQLPVDPAVLSHIDATYPTDWAADPLLGLHCP